MCILNIWTWTQSLLFISCLISDSWILWKFSDLYVASLIISTDINIIYTEKMQKTWSSKNMTLLN